MNTESSRNTGSGNGGLPTLKPHTIMTRTTVFFLCHFLLMTLLPAMSAVDETNVLSYQVEADLPLLSRLGLWNGTGFDEMSSGTLPAISNQNVYFISHGWAPDYRAAIDADPSLRAWSPGLTYQGKEYGTFYYELAPVIAAYDPSALIFAFSWVDDSATNNILEAYQSEAKTVLNGQRLGAAIDQVIPMTFSGNVHLMGHSHGAKVVTVAAGTVANQPQQVTLFDSPEDDFAWFAGASNNLVPYLQELAPGRSPGTIFIDNYISEFGERYGTYTGTQNIVDVALNPAQYGELDFSSRHSYPMLWYSDGSTAANQPGGDQVGLKWSPLYGTLYETLSGYYKQEWTDFFGTPIPAEEFNLVAQNNVPGTVPEWLYQDTVLTDLASERGSVSITTNAFNEPVSLTLTTMNAGGPGVEGLSLWHGSFTKEASMNALYFLYDFLEIGDGDEFSIWVDDQLRFLISGLYAGTNQKFGLIDLDALSNGLHQLTVALHAFGMESATIQVEAFQFVSIPEPSFFSLAGFAVFCLLVTRRSRRL